MKTFRFCLAVSVLVFALGATVRETGKLYIIVDNSTQHVLRMGISPESVLIENSKIETLIVIEGEKPVNLSENYFKIQNGVLVEMTVSEMNRIDSDLKAEKDNAEVAKLKIIMARDPAGFRQVLGL